MRILKRLLVRIILLIVPPELRRVSVEAQISLW